jgi:hypothetical protein
VLTDEGAVTPTELARELGMARSTLIFRVNRMIDRGDARRMPKVRAALADLVAAQNAVLEREAARTR